MPHLTNPSAYELSEIDALRDRRSNLLREAKKHPLRLHAMTALTTELRQVTTQILKLELKAGQQPDPQPHYPETLFSEPLGDAGAVGGHAQGRLAYKD